MNKSVLELFDFVNDRLQILLWQYIIETDSFFVYEDGIFVDDKNTYVSFLMSIFPEDRIIFDARMQLLMHKKKEKDSFDIRILKKGKIDEYEYYHCYIETKIEDNKIVGIIGTLQLNPSQPNSHDMRDVEVEQKNYFLKNIFEGAKNIFNWDFNIINQVFRFYVGAEEQKSFTVKDFAEWIHLDDRSKYITFMELLNSGQQSIENVDMRIRSFENTDEYIHVIYNATAFKDPEGNVTRYIGYFINKTDCIKVTEDLVRKNEILAMTFDAGGITPIVWNLDTDNIYISNSRHKEVRNTSDEFYDREGGVLFSEVIANTHPEDQKALNSLYHLFVSGRTKNHTIEFRYDVQKRFQKYFELNLKMLSTDGVKGRQAVGFLYDVTKRKESALEAKKEEAYVKKILDSIPFPVMIKQLDERNPIIYWNTASVDLFGDVTYFTSYDFLSESDAVMIKEIDSQVIKTGVPYTGYESLLLRDGRMMNTYVIKKRITQNGKHYILAIRQNMTEQINLQRKNKAITTSLNKLEAYPWTMNLDTMELVYNEGENGFLVKKENIETVFDYANTFVHIDDRKRYIQYFQNLKDKKHKDFFITYRADFNNSGIFKYWESRGTIEESVQRDESTNYYAYGLDLNINKHKEYEQQVLEASEKLEQLNNMNNLILRNAQVGLVFVDMDYHVVWENLSYYIPDNPFTLFHYTGRYCKNCERKSVCENCVVDRSVQSGELVQAFIDFNETNLELLAIPVFNDKKERIGTVLRVIDLTERIKMKELEEETRIAQRSDKLKSAFLANISHEVRTPLNAIVGFSQLLISSDDAEVRQQCVNLINSNNDLLLRLVNDLLDLSKIEAGFTDIKYNEFDVKTLVHKCYISAKKLVTDKNEITIILEDSYQKMKIKYDANRLQQILLNFITNAVKYTDKGTVIIGYKYEEGGIQVYVKDTGIGIPENKKEKIFQRFQKLNDFSQGTGLGLSICKAIVDASNGKIGFTSEEGKGSEFWAWIPAEALIVIEK